MMIEIMTNDLRECNSWVADMLAHKAALESDHRAMREALEELVALKDLNERNDGWPNLRGNLVEQADYKRRKPLAWEAARAVLAGLKVRADEQPKEA